MKQTLTSEMEEIYSKVKLLNIASINNQWHSLALYSLMYQPVLHACIEGQESSKNARLLERSILSLLKELKILTNFCLIIKSDK